MLYHLLYPLSEQYFIFNIFRYITFRAMGATLTAFILAFIFGPFLIKWLQQKKMKELIREDVPDVHVNKEGTPTMGGLLILFAMIISILLWANLSNIYIWIMLAVIVLFATIGLIDDYKKLTGKKGLRGKLRLIIEFSIAFILAYIIYKYSAFTPIIKVPFFKDFSINIGWLYIPFIAFIVVGSANAVNLTDGLDGLAIFPVMTCAFTYGIFAYITGHAVIANYLQIQFVPGTGELAIVCGAMVASGLGFLWYNTYPAQVFMGDTGAISLGGAIGTLAVITKNELLLVIVGGLFVMETLSVISQVVSFKLTGKRIFKMAPLHHHFELKGWAEPKVIVRFWIISIILAVVALSTLKLR